MYLYLMLYEESYLHICVSTNLIVINDHIIATVEYSVPQKPGNTSGISKKRKTIKFGLLDNE